MSTITRDKCANCDEIVIASPDKPPLQVCECVRHGMMSRGVVLKNGRLISNMADALYIYDDILADIGEL